jgi:DNA-binding response OmpR family regulator
MRVGAFAKLDIILLEGRTQMIQLTLDQKKVLVVARTLQGIGRIIAPLREAGSWVELATTPSEALQRAAILNPDVVVIEDQLADIDSVELSREIRTMVSSGSPPILIMAPSRELAEPACQSDPSVDSLTKRQSVPLASRIAELLAPVPRQEAKSLEQLNCRGLRLDRIRHRAWVNDRPMKLTPTEFRLLWELASRPGCVLSRADLTKVCRSSVEAMHTRTIDAHVKAIRRKLKGDAALVETVHGVGYRFQDWEW